MTVETFEAVLAHLIQFMLADRGVQVESVSIFRVTGHPEGTNWTANCTAFPNCDAGRVELATRNLLPALLRKYRLR